MQADRLRVRGWYVSTVGVAIAATVLIGCQDGGPTAVVGPIDRLPRQLTSAEVRLVTANNTFAMGLFRELDGAAGPDSNVFLSPLSASMALGLAATGADGATLDAMRGTLGYPGEPITAMGTAYHSLTQLLESLDPHVTLRIADAIWNKQSAPLLPSFVSTAQSDFGASVGSLDAGDAAATKQVNAWVDSATAGRIPKLVSSIPESIWVFLANAVYFHGSWQQRFDPSKTHDTLFTLRGGATTPVQLMTGQLMARATQNETYVAADLPYGNTAFALTVIIPRGVHSTQDLIGALTDGGWSTLVSNLEADSALTSVAVELPKFTTSWGDTLTSALTTLGMGVAFTNMADFSNMSTTPLHISVVVQRTYVSVDEDGTTAAAATGVGFGPTIEVEPLPVYGTRPFVYAIRERLTGTLLFIGVFAHPPAP